MSMHTHVFVGADTQNTCICQCREDLLGCIAEGSV